MRLPRPVALIAAPLAAVAAVAAGCGGSSSSGGGSPRKVTIVAYSTPKEAYARLIAAFERTPAGRGVSFSQSYGASGEQSRAVQAGLPADYVAFSLAPDVTRLVKAGLVPAAWSRAPHHGMVSDSVVVLAVRNGNPKHIRGWQDLVRPGVQVITPNPITSGGARWNILAAYGAQRKQGRSDAQAAAYLRRLFANVTVQDKSGRDALQTFTGGKGDVLITYENEAITARRKGAKLDYLIPRQTILIENPIALTKGASTAARRFAAFALSRPGQRIFAASGYRPVIGSLRNPRVYPTPPGLFRISYLGGWSAVSARFFDPERGIVSHIERQKGVSTSGG